MIIKHGRGLSQRKRRERQKVNTGRKESREEVEKNWERRRRKGEGKKQEQKGERKARKGERKAKEGGEEGRKGRREGRGRKGGRVGEKRQAPVYKGRTVIVPGLRVNYMSVASRVWL